MRSVNTGDVEPVPPSRSRIGGYYGILGTLTAVVIAAVLSAGSGKQAQPAIAGGYDAAGASDCLGPKFDVSQSGRFVTISSAGTDIGGDVTFEDGRLTGT